MEFGTPEFEFVSWRMEFGVPEMEFASQKMEFGTPEIEFGRTGEGCLDPRRGRGIQTARREVVAHLDASLRPTERGVVSARSARSRISRFSINRPRR